MSSVLCLPGRICGKSCKQYFGEMLYYSACKLLPCFSACVFVRAVWTWWQSLCLALLLLPVLLPQEPVMMSSNYPYNTTSRSTSSNGYAPGAYRAMSVSSTLPSAYSGSSSRYGGSSGSVSHPYSADSAAPEPSPIDTANLTATVVCLAWIVSSSFQMNYLV